VSQEHPSLAHDLFSAVTQVRVGLTLDSRTLQDALRLAIATRRHDLTCRRFSTRTVSRRPAGGPAIRMQRSDQPNQGKDRRQLRRQTRGHRGRHHRFTAQQQIAHHEGCAEENRDNNPPRRFLPPRAHREACPDGWPGEVTNQRRDEETRDRRRLDGVVVEDQQGYPVAKAIDPDSRVRGIRIETPLLVSPLATPQAAMASTPPAD